MKLQLKKTLKAGATAGLLLSGLLAPNLASAVSIWIDDSSDYMTVTTDAGTPIIVQEGDNILGQVDWSYSYHSTDASAPASGVTQTYLYNFADLTLFTDPVPPGSLYTSDTLSVTVTGNGGGNVDVVLQFLSGSTTILEATAFPMPPAVLLDECQGNLGCGDYDPVLRPNPIWIGINPLSDLNIQIASAAVPEPMTLTLMAFGLAAFGARRRFA